VRCGLKISGVNPDTGKETEYEAEGIGREFIDAMFEFKLTDEHVTKLIDGLNVSADIKSLLYAFSKATIKVGSAIVKVGRKIIDYICELFSQYPSAGFGLIFGAIAGFLVSAIPILGIVLGPLVSPILIGIGFVLGLNEDIKDKALARKVAEINAKFNAFA